ncbi:hypothetical protein [Phytobacter diazotrophicus]|uniref:hypothetical protein n=1 Tax=Phytobacter diazotrophicus TaxID=395631 RepID=UPI002FEEA22B
MITKNQPYGDQDDPNLQLYIVLRAIFPQGQLYESSKTYDPDGFMYEFVVDNTQYTVDCNRRGMCLLKGADRPGDEDTHFVAIRSGGVYHYNWRIRYRKVDGEVINEVEKAILNIMVPYF